jgi:hypothetical protein
MPRTLGQDRERRDMQAELARLGHLAQAGAQAEEGVATDTGRQVGDGELDVVNAVVLQPEDVAVAVLEGRDEGFEIGHVVGELLFGAVSAREMVLLGVRIGGGGTLSNTVFIS